MSTDIVNTFKMYNLLEFQTVTIFLSKSSPTICSVDDFLSPSIVFSPMIFPRFFDDFLLGSCDR